MDAAHNAQKMQAFVGSFTKNFPLEKADILLSMKNDRVYKDVLPILKPICERLILTSFKVKQDRINVSVDTKVLKDTAKELGFKTVLIEDDVAKAYQLLLSGPTKVGIITGSFYLINTVRATDRKLIASLGQ
jgi:folylpolyglutamate synthase/dihydropteroate synthase